VIVIQFPKPDVDHIEIFVAEEVRVQVDVWLSLDIEETLQYVGLLELPETHLVIVLSIGNVEHSVDGAKGIPLLKFRSFLKEI
jgi:hypothetical protein